MTFIIINLQQNAVIYVYKNTHKSNFKVYNKT